jgi:hypothetical protein
MVRNCLFLFMIGLLAASGPALMAGAEPSPALPSSNFNLQQRKAEHWAWHPISAAAPPEVRQAGWASSPIDRFILSKLESRGLHPAARADKRALIRRAWFDLIGLPPTPAAIDSFLKDDSSSAFAKVVDGLLASPHFGERWGRHWLDLARYAETYGHEFDYPITGAWQYRDYVIRALNADVPYDQFVMEQVAGDLLPEPRINPVDGYNESIIGTGFWCFGEDVQAPVDVRQHRADRIDNQIDVFGKTFLGLTINCARCHDHKFDAIRQKDYYALAGFLKSSRRQDALLDPHGKIAALARQLTQGCSEGDSTLVGSLPRSGKELSDEFKTKLLSVASDKEMRERANPLYSWAMLSDSSDFNAGRKRVLADLEAQQRRADDSRKSSVLYKSFSDGDFNGWFVTGNAFGDRPTRAGEWDSIAGGAHIVHPGVAHSGMLAGQLRGVLRSPTFTLTRPEILYHAAGRAGKIRLIIDGFRIDEFNPLLFAGAIFGVDTGGQFVWHRQAQDIGRYVGHQAHIEIIDDGDGWVAVDEIRFADKDAPLPLDEPSTLSRAVLNDPKVTSPDALATAYADKLGIELDSWRAGKQDQAGSELAAWSINHRLISVDRAAAAKLTTIKAQQDALGRDLPAPMIAPALADGTGIDEYIYTRGSYKTPGEIAPRQFLEAIGGSNQPPISRGCGRLALARRMVDPSDPFLSRVMVNRIWHHLLGRGIVASVDNFGVMGSPPSHPELLDYLASQFMREGWSVKKMIRSVMLSSTYQMASLAGDANAEQIDPDNVLLHRANVRRLEAEAIRDSILAVSGRLNEKEFGPGIDVYLTPFMEGRGRPNSGPLDGAGRRSIYLAVRRNFLSPMMLAFDMTSPFSTMGRRNVSNVPAQGLILMNDPFVIEQAKLWANRTLAMNCSGPQDRINAMYLAAYGRPAADAECSRILAFCERQGQELNIAPAQRLSDPRVWASVAHALFNTKEFIFLN